MTSRMSDTTHTPGPWTVWVGRRSVEVQCRARTPVVAWPGFDDSNRPVKSHRANAARIVTCVNACEGINPEAVPGLLAALENCFKALEGPALDCNYDGENPCSICAAQEAARKAIAKATGANND